MTTSTPDIPRHFEIYIEGLRQLHRIPIEKQTKELIRIAMVFNRYTVDYCVECAPICPLYTTCRRRPRHQIKQAISVVS